MNIKDKIYNEDLKKLIGELKSMTKDERMEFSKQYFNRVIKQICERLSKTIPFLSKKEKTLLKKSEKEKE